MNRIMKCGLILLSLIMVLSFGVTFGEQASSNATPMKEMKAEKFPVFISNVDIGKTAQTIEVNNIGDSSQDLTGWKLEVLNKTVYTFPPFMLDANAKVNVHSGTGKDSQTDLYASKNLVTNASEMVSLLDANGKVVGTQISFEGKVKDFETRLKSVENKLSKSSQKDKGILENDLKAAQSELSKLSQESKGAAEKDLDKLEGMVKELEQKVKAAT